MDQCEAGLLGSGSRFALVRCIDRFSRAFADCGGRGRFRSLPLAQAWTTARDLPAPQGDTFMAQWQRRKQHD